MDYSLFCAHLLGARKGPRWPFSVTSVFSVVISF